MTVQELQERTVPDSASVAAIVAMAMRMCSGSKPERLFAIPIDAGLTSGQPLVLQAIRGWQPTAPRLPGPGKEPGSPTTKNGLEPDSGSEAITTSELADPASVTAGAEVHPA